LLTAHHILEVDDGSLSYLHVHAIGLHNLSKINIMKDDRDSFHQCFGSGTGSARIRIFFSSSRSLDPDPHFYENLCNGFGLQKAQFVILFTGALLSALYT